MTDPRPALFLLVLGTAAVASLTLGLTRASRPPPEASHDGQTAARGTDPDPAAASGAIAPTSPPTEVGIIDYPTDAISELAILTDAKNAEVGGLLTVAGASGALEARHCGDAATCTEVTRFAAEDEHVTVELAGDGEWPLPPDLAKAAPTLTDAERAGLARSRIVLVRVIGPASPSQLPARAAFAYAGAIAEKTRGFVFDRAAGRIETAHDFVARAITAPLEAPAFRRDRIEVRSVARDPGTVRLVTAGLLRFGAPELEIVAAPIEAVGPLTDILYGIADQLAASAEESPLQLTLRDLEEIRGAAYSPGAHLPDPVPIPVAIETVRSDPGDPSVSLARLVPADGATRDGYDRLVRAFFGDAPAKWDAASEWTRAVAASAQAALRDELAKLKATKGATLRVRLAQRAEAKGDGARLRWADVRSAEGDTVSVAPADDPTAAPVRRARGDVVDFLMVLPDGRVESPRHVPVKPE